KFADDVARSRASSPKLQMLNTALMSATSGLAFAEARAGTEVWGRLVESAVGAHLAKGPVRGASEPDYWPGCNLGVDFIATAAGRVVAVEVKSGRVPQTHAGTSAFVKAFRPDRTLLVGSDGVSLEEFLLRPVEHWVGI